MSAATRATKPVAMTGLPALFVDPAAAEVVADADDLDAETAEVVVGAAVVAGAALAAVVPPMGAVDWPSISAWTEELNDPLIPAKLF